MRFHTVCTNTSRTTLQQKSEPEGGGGGGIDKQWLEDTFVVSRKRIAILLIKVALETSTLLGKERLTTIRARRDARDNYKHTIFWCRLVFRFFL